MAVLMVDLIIAVPTITPVVGSKASESASPSHQADHFQSRKFSELCFLWPPYGI